jgi:hypothetical protein
VFAEMGGILNAKNDLESALRNVYTEQQGRAGELETQLQQYLKRRDGLISERSGIVEAIGKKLITDEEAEQRLDVIRADIKTINNEVSSIMDKISSFSMNLPDDVIDRIDKLLTALTGRSGRNPLLWPDDAKKKFARFLFGIGNREYGVFVRLHDDPTVSEHKVYEIRGALGTAAGALGANPHIYDMYQEMVIGQIEVPALRVLSESLDLTQLPTEKYVSQYFSNKINHCTKMGSWS